MTLTNSLVHFLQTALETKPINVRFSHGRRTTPPPPLEGYRLNFSSNTNKMFGEKMKNNISVSF